MVALPSRSTAAVPTVSVPAWTRFLVTDRWACQDTALTPADRQRLDSRTVSNRVAIRQLHEGIEIETNSYVGVLPLDGFILHITPRISPRDLMRMIDYCFDVSSIHLMQDMGFVHASHSVPTDLLVSAFLREVQRLLSAGLLREYVERQDDLMTKRGRIRFQELARRPCRAVFSLPCRYEERSADVFLNRLLLTVVQRFATCASSPQLRRAAHRTEEQMSQLCNALTVGKDSFVTAISGLNRLSRRYEKALTLAALLYEGVSPDQDMPETRRFTAFLLNMNSLFEHFIGRLLEEFRPPGISLVYQESIPSLYRLGEREYRHPRPDFMLFDNRGRCTRVVDAKYKFLDEREVDSGDLYQLTVYALATQPRRAVALYPGEGGSRREYEFRGLDSTATVVFRSVNLDEVWAILDGPDRLERGRSMVSALLE